ncbi:MAG: 50S ribosomal protein L10 [Candidatus Omnitrophica bacterium]|nr:50S ribosomal protein L10 [Candidatus Omnitrophota bacterium]
MAKKEKLARMCKEKMIDEIVSGMKEKPNFIITSYMGSSVADLEQLRRNLKKSSSSYFVVKNSVLKIVFDKLDLKDEIAKIDSGMGISLSGEDVVSTCKVLATFAKDHDKFKIKGAIIDGKSMSQERVKQLASLPSKQILLTQMVVTMKSPITGLVMTLSGVLRKFVVVLDAIKTKQGVAAPAAPEQKA